MAKKLVFSGYKFLEDCLEVGFSDAFILECFDVWATECEGKTEEEMGELGYLTKPAWMVEVDA